MGLQEDDRLFVDLTSFDQTKVGDNCFRQIQVLQNGMFYNAYMLERFFSFQDLVYGKCQEGIIFVIVRGCKNVLEGEEFDVDLKAAEIYIDYYLK